jgi:hypothetical protein
MNVGVMWAVGFLKEAINLDIDKCKRVVRAFCNSITTTYCNVRCCAYLFGSIHYIALARNCASGSVLGAVQSTDFAYYHVRFRLLRRIVAQRVSICGFYRPQHPANTVAKGWIDGFQAHEEIDSRWKKTMFVFLSPLQPLYLSRLCVLCAYPETH